MGQHQPAPLRKMAAPAAAALSRWLLAPHQLRAARQRQLLIDSLTAVLPVAEESSQVGLAILQGARALSLADGDFDQEEWELFYFCLKSLRLSDAQRQSADLHGAPDPKRISASLAAIADHSQRLAIARCYCLFAAADGQGKAAELGLLPFPAPGAWSPGTGAGAARALPPLSPCAQLVGSLAPWLGPAASPLGFSPPPPLNGHG